MVLIGNKNLSLLKTSAVVFFLFLFVSCGTMNGINGKNKSRIKYRNIVLQEEFYYAKSDIIYPEFDDYAELNTIVKNTILSNYKTFKNAAENDFNEIKKERGSDNAPVFEYKTEISVSDNAKYISVLIQTYTYTGGAHGNTNFITYTMNKQSRKLANITEVSNLSYVQLSKYCNKTLVERFSKDKEYSKNNKEMQEWINEGTFPTPDNYEIFTVNNNILSVYFEEYTVAPYAYGPQCIEIKIE